jgi:hypothetical protein
MGDMPICVAHDSADVWAHPDMEAVYRGVRTGTVIKGETFRRAPVPCILPYLYSSQWTR